MYAPYKALAVILHVARCARLSTEVHSEDRLITKLFLEDGRLSILQLINIAAWGIIVLGVLYFLPVCYRILDR